MHQLPWVDATAADSSEYTVRGWLRSSSMRVYRPLMRSRR